MLVVAGASGNLGRSVASRLLELVEPGEVVLVSRTPDRLADLADRGAVVRRGDFDDPGSLAGAFAGGRRLLLISATDLGVRVGQHRAAIAAAADAGIGHIVYTSVVSPDPANAAVVVESHGATEADVRASGLEWTMLRNNLYAEFQAPEMEQALASGKLIHNRGNGRAAYVSREDCAAAAAAVLAGDGHAGQAYDITGPESLGAEDLAMLYGELGGKPIEPVAISDDELIAMIAGDSAEGHLVYGAQLVASFGRAIREGHFAAVGDAVERLTGSAPRTLRAVLEQR